MGIALGLGKISATLWLKQNWNIAPWSMRIYLFTAIIVLMIVTSMGIFGFLSKAHSDQSLVSGDVLAKIYVYDEKIKTEKENIEANRKALKQMDEAVDQVMGRSSSETGADKAVAIRRSQQKERGRLQQDIAQSQQTIAALNEQRAPIAAEVRKVEAEVGPIKYIAAFIYGETDQTILEKAVTWVIIILIVVFDPMAVILLLSSQISFQNFREREDPNEKELQEFADAFNEVFTEGDSPTEPVSVVDDQLLTVTESIHCHKCNTELVNAPGIGLFCPNKSCEVVDGPFTDKEEKSLLEQHPYLNQPFAHFKNLEPMVHKPEEVKQESSSTYQILPVLQEELDKSTDTGLFVQNEEQKESDLWSKTAKAISPEEYQEQAVSRQEVTLNEWLVKLRNKEITMADVPEHLVLEIRARR
jgi:hypothetical protein